MGKCLVTKLSGSTENDNLNYLDSVVIQFKPVDVQTAKNSSIVIWSVSQNTPVKVECLKGNFTSSGFSTANGTSTDVTNARLYVSNGAIIKLSKKQDISKISFNDGVGDDSNKIIDFSDLKYCKGLKYLLISGDISGSVELANNNSLLYLSITNSNIYATTEDISKVLSPEATELVLTKATSVKGDISLLGDKIGLTKMNLTYTDISGSVESLLENMWRNRRRSGKVIIVTGHNLAFDWQTHGDYGYAITATFSDNSIVATSNITKTFNGSTWVKS
jgi:hypothetical protein